MIATMTSLPSSRRLLVIAFLAGACGHHHDAQPDLEMVDGGGLGGVHVNAVSLPATASADFLEYVAASPLVDGFNPAVAWGAIDQGPGAMGGQYQWATYDASIQAYFDAAAMYGKKVNLIVYAIGYSAADQPPMYVLNNAALDKVTCSQQTNWPVVYEAPFKNAYKAFITEVLAHYAGHPSLGYIRFGLSRGGEVDPFCAEQEQALAGAATLSDWFQNDWLPYDKEMLDYEKAQGSAIPIMAPTTQAGTPDITPTEAANAVADGFGFGCQGLAKIDLTNPPSTCTGDWCANFTMYTGHVQLELQTYGQSDAAGTLDDMSLQAMTGPLPPLITLALEYHATILELYADDLLLALDSNSTLNGGKGYCNNLMQCYSQYGAAYTDALKTAHGL
jgi:hypothetical protein